MIRVGFVTGVVITIVLMAMPERATAQSRGFEALYKDRAGRMEVTLGGHKTSAWDREVNGASIDVKGANSWSFGLAYNFDNHWNFGFNMDSSSPKYTAVLAEEGGGSRTINHKLSIYHAQFNGTYHFMAGAFTPYVQLGGGWSTFDSNLTQPGSQICWWDPWWMTYQCTWATYNSSEFSYNAGAGIRYELTRDFFVRAGYSALWAEAGNRTERFDLGRIEIGFML